MIYNIYSLWRLYCFLRAVHGAFITICFFKWFLGKGYHTIISVFSYFYEKKEYFNENKYVIEEKEGFLVIN
jgi:hypothetical protein